ncbi:hypothetical protein [uncultured Halomonas sp.]|uniref:hypothetical protein n=1 Tax=uncultured Halomonas sp. TaxID=173971 RepID=UPI00259973CA|nr:hypothetical protein [uncultured Halomonas sp.]|tara:strand:+ start:4773 stop:5081 length:309 start_codon:yes stop_codon:yes gene_type:complete
MDKQEWNGEGLPPVGAKVVVNCEDEAQVVGFFRDEVVFVFAQTGVADMEPLHNLSPIRSEERKAVDGMVGVMIDHYGHPKGAEGYVGLARALYRAGYRKIEQ